MAIDKNGKALPPGIRQRSNGKFEGRVQYESDRYSVYGNTITEVKKQMTDLRYKLEHGEFIASSKITLGEWFETWIEQYKKNQVKRGTIQNYNERFDCYIDPFFGKKKLTEIRGEHIQKFYNELIKEGLTASSVEAVSIVLNSCLNQAVKNGIIERNPVPLATLPKKKDKTIRRVLTKEEQAVFMGYAKDSYLYNLFSLALRTGLRGGEVKGLKFSDIDRSKNLLHIQRTLRRETGGGYYEDTPKTATSKRDIPLTEDMLAIIESERQCYGEKVLRLDGYIFHLPDGSPISVTRIQNEIDRITKVINKAGIHFDRFTPHCFRHTFATRAIENGMNPQTLKVILGHTSLSMTMDLYSHVLPSTKAEEMEMISKAF